LREKIFENDFGNKNSSTAAIKPIPKTMPIGTKIYVIVLLPFSVAI
jgi:hypothetical protein